jgi:preprotein translocase subunit YajC
VNGWQSLVPLVLIVLVFWVLVVRPARNQQKRLAKTQASVEVGTQVMLGSGFYGTVTALGDETLQIDLAPGTNVKVARQAVVRVIENENMQEKPADDRDADPSAE